MIFLDFDGVLFDTMKEAYVVATIAIGKYSTMDGVDFNTEYYKKFKKLRYLIAPAWNYKYLLEELEASQNLDTIKYNFMEKIKLVSKIDYANFEDKFFNTRDNLKNNYYNKWLDLNPPFPFLDEIKFLFLEFKDVLYIITTKEKSTVLKLLSLQNIKFNKNRVFDRRDYQKFGSKKNIIQSLLDKDTKSLFIDDSDKHIKDCTKIEGLRCFQPSWGYVSLDSQTVSSQIILNEINNLLGR